MRSPSVSFLQLPLVTKPEPTASENAYYRAYWQVMGSLFRHEFPLGEAYTIPELPLWVTRLGIAVRQAGCEARFVNLAHHTGPASRIDVGAMLDAATADPADVYCVSPFTANYELAVELAKGLRARSPRCVLVAGGPHVSELPEQCVADGFDYAVVGRGEGPLYHLLRGLAAGERVGNGHPGLVTRPDPREAAVPEDRAAFERFWQQPAHYDLIPSGYPMHYARVYATLGCPYRCSFCADTLWIGMRPYHQDLGRLRGEMAAMKSRFRPDVLFVGDEVFTLNQDYCAEVIGLLGELGIPWFCQTRANLLSRDRDRDLLKAMADSGCRLINIGAESSDPEVLKGLEKKVTHRQLVEACTRAKDVGLGVLTYWMVGGPGETPATARGTLRDMLDLFDRGLTDLADYFICTPYPGTSLFRDPDRYGVTIEPKPWRMWREDIPSVMRTAEMSAEDIYRTWLSGLDQITAAMRLC